MRMIKSIAIAAMLVAVAAAAPASSSETAALAHKSMLATQQATASIVKGFEAVPTLPRHMRKLKAAAHSLHRAFSAKQDTTTTTPAPTCDQAGFADATARVLQACPSLSGLVSGATSLEEFLPGFCASECYTALAEELVAHAACVDDTTAFLLDFVYTCQQTPQCFSEGFIVTGARLAVECDAQVNAAMDVTNVTTAAYADARLACSGTCIAEQATLVETYSVCLGTGVDGAAVAAAMRYMCSTPSGSSADAESCGVQLKAFGELQCESPTVCASSSKCSATCSPTLTTTNLNAACNSCLSGFLTQLSGLGEDPTQFALGIDLYCTKLTPGADASDSNPYCYPVALSTMAAATASGGTAATACVATTGASACTERVIGLAAAGLRSVADLTFVACLNVTASVSACLPRYEASLRAAAQTSVTGQVLCAQNDASGFCYDLGTQWIAVSLSCSGCSCSTDLGTLLTTTGCCAGPINNFLQVALDFPATYLASGTQTLSVNRGLVSGSTTFSYSHTARYSMESLTRDQLALGTAVACAGNTTEQWAIVESECASTLEAPPTSSFQVTLAWDRVNANAAVKAELEESLREDTARNAGVARAMIRNGTLARGSGEVQLTTTAGRRQTTSTGANCEYTFSVDGADTTTADATVAAIAAKQANGTFLTPSTATTTSSRCQECLDSRSNSLVNAAAPAPGAEPAAGATVSPASSVVVGFAAAVTAVATALAL